MPKHKRSIKNKKIIPIIPSMYAEKDKKNETEKKVINIKMENTKNTFYSSKEHLEINYKDSIIINNIQRENEMKNKIILIKNDFFVLDKNENYFYYY